MKTLKTTSLILMLSLFINQEYGFSWNNGPSGDAATDEDHPSCETVPYSTHDWIADHARALLPEEERKWLDDNKKLYLLGTGLIIKKFQILVTLLIMDMMTSI